MNDILTNGLEIKQRILSEIGGSNLCVFVAMAYFTDRDIASKLIEVKERGVSVDVILSSNAQNETVKLMLRGAGISVHAFETGDNRGIMHHKFCLVDNRISINGSYNFSYNASNNNVENIHVSDNYDTYSQLLAEFERLKYNIDNNIAVDVVVKKADPPKQNHLPVSMVDAFYDQLHNLVYSSSQLSTDNYKKKGYDKSKESGGSIDIFRAEYDNIKEEIRVFATNDGLGNLRNVLISNISNAYEGRRANLQIEKEIEISAIKKEGDIQLKQLKERISDLNTRKSLIESGNQSTGERGLLQVNKDIEKNKLEKKSLEESFVTTKFWSVGTILTLLGLVLLVFYLSVFFASAIYKVFFEGNIIRSSLEAGLTPAIPQIVDANAILKIFRQQGILFGLVAMLFFIIPILLSNLELLGSKKKWINSLCFVAGVLIFDIVVSAMVALNADEIKSLLKGEPSTMQLWEVVKHGEFWLIFVFGMIPLIITHFVIVKLENAYKNSQRHIVDGERSRKIKVLDEEMIELTAEKELLNNRLRDTEGAVSSLVEESRSLELALNDSERRIDAKYNGIQSQIVDIYEDFKSRITSGRIFTDEILDSVISAFKTGFIEYLPEYYAANEVGKRAKEIDQAVNTTN